jgi:glycosyltransferase involved in cell wall biosynthesis
MGVLTPIRFSNSLPIRQGTIIEPKPAPDSETAKVKKVLHAPYNPAGQMSTQVAALRSLGVPARFCTYFNSRFDYPTDIPSPLPDTRSNRAVTVDFAIEQANQYDIFHFHGGQTFTINAYTDLPYLKMMNKKIIMNYWGSEVRRESLARINNPYVRVKIINEPLQLELLNVVSRFADAVIVPDHELYEYVKMFFDNVFIVRAAVDYKRFTPRYPDVKKAKPLVVHAPSDPVIKGTELVNQSVQRLKSVANFDYVQIENMKNEEALGWFQKADIIVDQLLLGIYGTVSIEGMLMGKPVISFVREDLVDKYPAGMPVFNANPNTIDKVLLRLIRDPDLRHEFGKRGRDYAVQHHDPAKIARQLVTIYNQL